MCCRYEALHQSDHIALTIFVSGKFGKYSDPKDERIRLRNKWKSGNEREKKIIATQVMPLCRMKKDSIRSAKA